jgi:hypothetical protein
MDWTALHYEKKYAPNSRESFRRQTVHQFVQAGIALINPDDPRRKVNSSKTVYQITPEVLNLLRSYGSDSWLLNLRGFLTIRETLSAQYASVRNMNRVPVVISPGQKISLTPGEHSELIKSIIEDFASRFVPGSDLVYAGDTGDKFALFNHKLLNELGVFLDPHGKMPDVVFYDRVRNWLILVESVTSHGPVDGKRHIELSHLFEKSTAGLVYVTAFPDRHVMGHYLGVISWETEVWCADSPTHLIHFNGQRFLGPYSHNK